MYPPQHVLDEIQEIHPQIRVGWIGYDRSGPDEELNKGDFYLIQLVPKRAMGLEFNEPWGDKGPIYGQDWNRMDRVPFMAAGPLDTEDMFSGAVCKTLRKLCSKSAWQRRVDSAAEKGNEYDRQVTDLAGEIGEHLWWQANQTGHTGPDKVANKHLTPDEKAVLNGDSKKDLKNSFMPSKTPKM